MTNVDAREIEMFDTFGDSWWEEDGPFKSLHDINPLRLDFIQRSVDLRGLKVLDVGCGGGILSEGLARAGATVSSIDLAEDALACARKHAKESGLTIDYRAVPAEQLAEEKPGEFDVVVCMEMLEHVPDPSSICRALSTLVKPGGDVYLSTLNRNPKSWLFAIVAAERILRLLPAGTHQHEKFIRPHELATFCRECDLDIQTLRGMGYNPLTRRYSLNDDLDVNYLAHAKRQNDG